MQSTKPIKSESETDTPQDPITSPDQTAQETDHIETRPLSQSPQSSRTVTGPQLTDQAKALCIFGKRGSGKTTLIHGRLNECRPPVVVLDVLGNFSDDSFFSSDSISETIDEIKKQIESDRYKIISLQTADPNLSVDFISAALYESNGGTLVLDEVDAFNISESACFDQLIRYGRNKNVSVITGCRRPAEISRNITAAANKIMALKTNEPRDVDYFSGTVFGERAYELLTMPEFHGLLADYDQSKLHFFKFDERGQIYILKSEQL